jgi:hypothetical protein
MALSVLVIFLALQSTGMFVLRDHNDREKMMVCAKTWERARQSPGLQSAMDFFGQAELPNFLTVCSNVTDDEIEDSSAGLAHHDGRKRTATRACSKIGFRLRSCSLCHTRRFMGGNQLVVFGISLIYVKVYAISTNWSHLSLAPNLDSHLAPLRLCQGHLEMCTTCPNLHSNDSRYQVLT